MTVEASKRGEKICRLILPYCVIAVSVLVLLFRSADIAESARHGMRLAASSVIPSVFPFLVLSDYLGSSEIGSSGIFSKIFSKITGLAPKCFTAFICGNICGFPCGAKCAVNLYRCGVIGREECERAIGVSNNPSLAFVVSGVGAGMCGDVKIGVILYVILIISSVITAIFFRTKRCESKNTDYIIRQNYNFVESIKNAGVGSLSIASYIVFFSVILGALRSIVRDERVITLFSTLLEVGNAALNISSNSMERGIALALLAFALGFSGLCVHFQTFEFMPHELSKKKYILIKLTEGAIAAAVAFIVSTVI